MPRKSMGYVFTVLLAASSLRAETNPADTAREVYDAAKIPGGLVVCLGCEDPDLLAALRVDEHFLVQAFDRDAARVAAARQRLKELNVYGPVSALVFGGRLPYPDNTVNCVVALSLAGVPDEEIQRVLCPGGALCRLENGRWIARRKPVPAEVDEWTQFLYDAGNNAVSHDRRVGPPRSLQWVAAPRWARDHGQLGWVMVTAGGKVFSVEDEGPISHAEAPPVWKVVCRDAYSGLVLWRRDLPEWFEHLYFRAGPNQLMRRLVAQNGRLYATLGLCAPVSVLDPDTGRTIRTIEGTDNASELIGDAGTLFVLVTADLADHIRQFYLPWTAGLRDVPPSRHKILAVAADSGKILWQKEGDETANVMELTLAADARHVYFLNAQNLVCLDRSTGQTRWKTPRAVATNRPTWSTPTLVADGGMVFVGERDATQRASNDLLSNGGAPCTITAFSAEDGQQRWQCPAEDGFHFPVDVMAIGGRLWSGATASKEKPGFVAIRDALSGEVLLNRRPDEEFTSYSAGHHRCHRNKATLRWLITGRDGIQWIDVDGGGLESDLFLRGNCQFGVLPANGLLYVPPNGCACNFYEKLPGVLAFSPTAPQISETTTPPQPVGGPAAKTSAPLSPPAADEWPAFRHDDPRSGTAATDVPLPVTPRWTRTLGGRLSSLTSAGGRVFAAAIDRHTLYALDAADGRRLWEFTADGRIDSPPTLAGGRAYFGSCDGCVYAVDAATGELAWKLQAAPLARFISSYGQMESSWPLSGSVLVREGFVYALAGRSPYLDGGMWLYKLDATDGRVAARRRIAETPEGRNRDSLVCLPDVLSADAESLYVRQARFDLQDLETLRPKPHLWSGTGFLDDTRYNRAYWMYAERLEMGNPHWFTQGNTTPAGRILCFDEASFYAFAPSVYGGFKRRGQNPDHLYAAPRDYKTLPLDKNRRFAAAERQFVIPQWSVDEDLDVLAMVRTAHGLFVAGPAEGGKGALRAVDPDNGRTQGEWPLPAAPVVDGLIASSGRLLLVLADGSIACLAAGPERK